MISGMSSLVAGLMGAIAGVLGIAVSIAFMMVAGILVPLAVLGLPLLLIMAVIWLLGLPSARRARRCAPREAPRMHDVYRGLARMQNRLDSLETILLDEKTYARR